MTTTTNKYIKQDYDRNDFGSKTFIRSVELRLKVVGSNKGPI